MFKISGILLCLLFTIVYSYPNQLMLTDFNYKFDNDSPKVENMMVEDNARHFVPLGWPIMLTCPAITRAYQIGIQSDIVWQNVPISQLENGKPYNAGIATTNDNNMFHQCSLEKSPLIKSNVRIIVQNCNASANNLNNPCQYGMCHGTNTSVECQCFAQYTGLYCDIHKVGGFIHSIIPISIPMMFVMSGIAIMMLKLFSGVSKIKQFMDLQRHVIPIDKRILTHRHLFRADYYTPPVKTKEAVVSKPSKDVTVNNDVTSTTQTVGAQSMNTDISAISTTTTSAASAPISKKPLVRAPIRKFEDSCKKPSVPTETTKTEEPTVEKKKSSKSKKSKKKAVEKAKNVEKKKSEKREKTIKAAKKKSEIKAKPVEVKDPEKTVVPDKKELEKRDSSTSNTHSQKKKANSGSYAEKRLAGMSLVEKVEENKEEDKITSEEAKEARTQALERKKDRDAQKSLR